MKELVVEILKKNEESIKELEKKIENGGNKKSIESVICGIRKNFLYLFVSIFILPFLIIKP